MNKALVLQPGSARRVWYTPRGAWGNAQRIIPRCPDTTGWVMMTLTVDPVRYPDQGIAYLEGSKRLRVLLQRMKRHGFLMAKGWARKMELQLSGMPHWHWLLKLRKLTVDEMQSVSSWWEMGRVNFEYVRTREFHYLLKYCTKSVEGFDVQNDGLFGLPQWVLDLRKRVVWWQTYRFYIDASASVPRGTKSTNTSKKLSHSTIRERLLYFFSLVQVLVKERLTDDSPVFVSRREKIIVDGSANLWLVALVKGNLTAVRRWRESHPSPTWAESDSGRSIALGHIIWTTHQRRLSPIVSTLPVIPAFVSLAA